MYYITVAYAQLERSILRERVKAGMERAAAQGTKSGKPIGRKALNIAMPEIIQALKSKGSVSGASRSLKVSRAYITEKLKAAGVTPEGVIKGTQKITFEKC
jgi:DNA invertase Pin-like site-specific DNA recombinase